MLKYGRRLGITTTLGLCAVVVGFSQSSRQQEQNGLTISGIVLNDLTSQPLGRATITARQEKGTQEDVVAVTSGLDGRFSISGVAAGRYLLTVERSGYTAAKQEKMNRSIEVNPGLDAEITFRLVPCAAVTGRVMDTNNEALIGATVQLLQASLVNGKLALTTVSETVSNDLGDYRIFGMSPGRYYVSAFFRDTASVFGLHNRRSPKGETEDNAAEEYTVTYYPGTQDPSLATSMRMKPGETFPNVDVRIEMARSMSIEGAIDNLPPGIPARVFLNPADTHALGTRQVFVVEKGKTRFFFKSIPPGEYVLNCVVATGQQQLSARYPVSLTGASMNHITLVVQPSPSLKGAVVVAGDGAVPSGAYLKLTGGNEINRARIPIQRDGQFAIPSLPRDSYRVDIDSPQNPIVLKSLDLNGRKLNSPVLEIDQPIDALSVSVMTKPGEISGVATSRSGDPMAQGLVVAVISSDQAWRTYVTELGPQGTFKFAALLPAEYKVICFSDLDSQQDITREALKRVSEQGENVTVGEGEKKSIRVVAVEAEPR